VGCTAVYNDCRPTFQRCVLPPSSAVYNDCRPTFQRCVLPPSSGMLEAVRTSETSVDNHFTRQYNPEDSSEHYTRRRENLKFIRIVIC
jgi:hypothetical protein